MTDQQKRRCGTKVIYISLDEAERNAKRMHKRYKAKFEAYSCPHCFGFHVGQHRSKEAAIRRWKRAQA